MIDLKTLKLPKARLVILGRGGRCINVSDIFLVKCEFDKNGQETLVYTLSPQALEMAYQRLQAYKNQPVIVPSREGANDDIQ